MAPSSLKINHPSGRTSKKFSQHKEDPTDTRTTHLETDTLLDPSLIPSNGPKYFLVDQPSHIRGSSIFQLFNQVWIPVIFHHQYLASISVIFRPYFNNSYHMMSPHNFQDLVHIYTNQQRHHINLAWLMQKNPLRIQMISPVLSSEAIQK